MCSENDRTKQWHIIWEYRHGYNNAPTVADERERRERESVHVYIYGWLIWVTHHGTLSRYTINALHMFYQHSSLSPCTSITSADK